MKLVVLDYKVLLVILNKQIVMLCDRQFCVDCQWCFIA